MAEVEPEAKRGESGLEQAGQQEIERQAAAIMADDSLSQADRVRALYALGYPRAQIVEDFGFPRGTVYTVLPVRARGKVKPANNGQHNGGDDLPVVRQAAPGAGERPATTGLPARIDDRRQQIVPEYLMKHFLRLDDGRPLTPLETLILFQAARRSVMEDITILQGLVKTQAEATDTQLKVLREAKSESAEVAREAAQATAAQVVQYLEQKKPDIAATPHPLQGMMARMLERSLEPMLERMFTSLTQSPGQPPPTPVYGAGGSERSGRTQGGRPDLWGRSTPPGWVEKRREGGDV